jgi:UDP-3-O-[3-hydroxymyristoyl] glucosamine N-acyltransferase
MKKLLHFMRKFRRTRYVQSPRETFVGSGEIPRPLRFFSLDSAWIAQEIGGRHAHDALSVTSLSGLGPQTESGALVYLASPEYAGFLEGKNLSVIVGRDLSSQVPSRCAVIEVDGDARGAWSLAAEKMQTRQERFPSYISSTAVVSRDAVIIGDVYIDDHARVSPGAVIIGPTYIGRGSQIGPNSVIGSDGFEVVTRNNKRLVAPHIGGVWIDNDVTIHALCTVDKGMVGNFTYIGSGTMMDNHVHVAHAVQIGADCTLTACVEVSGSVRIGRNVWFSPQSCVTNAVSIGDFALIGLGASVRKSVDPHRVVVGNNQIMGVNCRCGKIYPTDSVPVTCPCGIVWH